jgi:hypothetical protein
MMGGPDSEAGETDMMGRPDSEAGETDMMGALDNEAGETDMMGGPDSEAGETDMMGALDNEAGETDMMGGPDSEAGETEFTPDLNEPRGGRSHLSSENPADQGGRRQAPHGRIIRTSCPPRPNWRASPASPRSFAKSPRDPEEVESGVELTSQLAGCSRDID